MESTYDVTQYYKVCLAYIHIRVNGWDTIPLLNRRIKRFKLNNGDVAVSFPTFEQRPNF